MEEFDWDKTCQTEADGAGSVRASSGEDAGSCFFVQPWQPSGMFPSLWLRLMKKGADLAKRREFPHEVCTNECFAKPRLSEHFVDESAPPKNAELVRERPVTLGDRDGFR